LERDHGVGHSAHGQGSVGERGPAGQYHEEHQAPGGQRAGDSLLRSLVQAHQD
jgi:hypothetical protein